MTGVGNALGLVDVVPHVAVFPDERFPGAATRGPEMRSTGEVMAGGDSPREAYHRALRAAGRSRRGGRIGPPLQLA